MAPDSSNNGFPKDQFFTQEDKIRKDYMKQLGIFIIIMGSFLLIFYLLYQSESGNLWLTDNVYILVIFAIGFVIYYAYIYFRYKRKLEVS